MEYDHWPRGQESPYAPYILNGPQPLSTSSTTYPKTFVSSQNQAQNGLSVNEFYMGWDLTGEGNPGCTYNNLVGNNPNLLFTGQAGEQFLTPDALYPPTESFGGFVPVYSHEIPSPNALAHFSYVQTPVVYGSPYIDPYQQHQLPWDFHSSAFYTPSSGAISSAASLSPVSDAGWQDSNLQHYQEEVDGEPLQGLGLYDCPDLTMDETDEDFGQADPTRFSLGKGLKLEESFQFEDADEDDDDDEDEDESDFEDDE